MQLCCVLMEGCLYYSKSGNGNSETDSLIELPSLPRNMDNLSQCTGRDWTLRRVGYHGEVVLLHATQATADTHARVVVRPIYLENEHVTPTLLKETADYSYSSVSLWTEWGYFKNPLAEPPLEAPEVEIHYDNSPIKQTSSTTSSGVSAKATVDGGTSTGKKRMRKDKQVKGKSGEAGEAHDGQKSTSSGRGRPPLAPSTATTGTTKRARPIRDEHGNGVTSAKEQKAAANIASYEEYKNSLLRPSAVKSSSSSFGYGYGYGRGGDGPDSGRGSQGGIRRLRLPLRGTQSELQAY